MAGLKTKACVDECMAASYRDIITIEPGRGGKPCIRGMRITMYDVLEYLASGMTQEEIWRIFLLDEADERNPWENKV